jgi:hypothetical protein
MKNEVKINNSKSSILVFKTSVSNQNDIIRLSLQLNNIIRNGKWNFDLDDCDNILRVESTLNTPHVIINLLNEHAFECVELED